MLVVLGQHAALLVVGGDLDVGAGFGAAATAHPGEEDVDAVTGLGREGEVDERVEQRRGVNGPLHDRLVALALQSRDELIQFDEFVVDEDVVQVPQLEGRPRGLEDEDEEEGDDREPELGVAQLSGAAPEHLHEQGPPRDEEQDQRQQEGEDEGCDVEEVGRLSGLPGHRVHADLGVGRPGGDLVAVEVVAEVAHLREEDRGHGEGQREEPNQGDEDGVGPGSGHGDVVGAGEVPLAVLDEEVPGEEQEGQRQEKEERVVAEAVNAAEDVAELPGVREDLHVQGERHAEAGQHDVADREVEEQVVAGGAGAFRAQRGHHEQQVAQDGDDDRHHVQRDPTPFVLVVELVAGQGLAAVRRAEARIIHDRAL